MELKVEKEKVKLECGKKLTKNSRLKNEYGIVNGRDFIKIKKLKEKKRSKMESKESSRSPSREGISWERKLR